MPEALELPEGLDSVTVTLFAPPDEFDFEGYLGRVESVPGYTIRRDRRAAFAVVKAPDIFEGGHAHLEVRAGAERIEIELEIIPGVHSSDGSAVNIDDAIGNLIGHLRAPDRTLGFLVAATIELDLRKWSPVLQLPFTPVGIADQLPGLPTIAGLDFAFKDRSEGQRLRRAFVTTYEQVNHLIVRLLLNLQQPYDVSVVRAAIELTAAHLPVFAKRRSDDTTDA